MEYGKIISTSWDLLWKNKILFIFGFFAALGGGSININSGFPTQNFPPPSNGGLPGELTPETIERFEDLIESFQIADFSAVAGGIAGLIGISVGVLLSIIALLIVLGIAIWLVSQMARAGLISAVLSEEQGNPIHWRQLMAAGTDSFGRIVGLKLLLYGIPLLIFLSLLAFIFGSIFLTLFNSAGNPTSPPPALFAFPFLIFGFVCIGIPVMIAIQLTEGYAFRAIVLEQMGVFDGVRRGWRVALDNLGSTFILALIFLAIGISFAIVTAIVILVPVGISFAFGISSWSGFLITAGLLSILGVIVGAFVNATYIALQSIAFTKAYLEFTRGSVVHDVAVETA